MFEYAEPQASLGQLADYMWPMTNFLGDYIIVCPQAATSNGYAKLGKSVYRYQYNHRSSVSTLPAWMVVTHSDELDSVFGQPLATWNKLNYTADEVQLSLKLVLYRSNFAKTG